MNGKTSKEQQMAQQVQNNKKSEGIESIPEGLAYAMHMPFIKQAVTNKSPDIITQRYSHQVTIKWDIPADLEEKMPSASNKVEEGDAIYNESVSSNDEGNSRFDGDDSKFVNNTDWDPDHQISE
ncbi:hypothetical protein KGF57_001007 [Candida theae]|uniref:Uncharacterized protein n=1 Tax=Candida theae TaxID=1198502 RepID=A0AAD5BHX5_9ASCO|nr:uncharacterized protein KGF57_001007 [Candida theae]KAI5964515.1 hypothetical protein KGF57_001007 [Candida theae]